MLFLRCRNIICLIHFGFKAPKIGGNYLCLLSIVCAMFLGEKSVEKWQLYRNALAKRFVQAGVGSFQTSRMGFYHGKQQMHHYTNEY